MGGSQTFQGAWSLSCTSFQAHTWGARFRSADSDLLGAACIFETHAHFVPPPESTRVEQGCVHGRREWFGLIINGAEVWRDLEPWRLGTLAAISMILGSGSRDLQTHQGKSWPGMHRVWTRVDSVIPVRKLTRYHVIFMCYLAKGRFLVFPRSA